MKPFRIPPAFPTLLVSALVAGCERTPTVPPAAPPLFEISDGAHGGTTGFYRLPPMVPTPTG